MENFEIKKQKKKNGKGSHSPQQQCSREGLPRPTQNSSECQIERELFLKHNLLMRNLHSISILMDFLAIFWFWSFTFVCQQKSNHGISTSNSLKWGQNPKDFGFYQTYHPSTLVIDWIGFHKPWNCLLLLSFQSQYKYKNKYKYKHKYKCNNHNVLQHSHLPTQFFAGPLAIICGQDLNPFNLT